MRLQANFQVAGGNGSMPKKSVKR